MKKRITDHYDSLPLLVRLLLQIFGGAVVGGVYRILRFAEAGRIPTLIAGLLATFTGVGNFVAWIADLISLIKDKKYTLFVE